MEGQGKEDGETETEERYQSLVELHDLQLVIDDEDEEKDKDPKL